MSHTFRKMLLPLASILTSVSLLLSGCGAIGSVLPGKTVTIQIVYGSEKQEWLDPQVKSFNDSHTKTKDGSTIVVDAKAMGSIEAVQGILDQTIQPVVWSPASSLYLPVANAEWRKSHADDLAASDSKNLLLSPVVIAMWQPMAQALGWPDKPIGWEDIGQLAVSTDGWSKYGFPEWGNFKFGHTAPGTSNSGLVAIIAQAYAAAKKQHGLTVDDLQKPDVQQFMANVQSSIIHYGTSTGFFATRMFERGPSYLSAAVMYENLVVSQESKRLSGQSQQPAVVAIYPKEGTFWANHPYVILNAPWVTDVQREAAAAFRDFLLARPQQQAALQLGFRPADPSIPLSAPLDSQHGIDPQQPKTVLEIPPAEVIQQTEAMWKQVKKPVDLVVVMDTSGSMEGEKISAARSSLVQFINLLDDRDRLQVTTFSDGVTILSPLTEIGPKRASLAQHVSGVFEGGSTRLYDAILQSYDELQKDGDPKHIRAIVVLSDGQDTRSDQSLDAVKNKLNASAQEGGSSVKLFTIGYGSDADASVLSSIAEITGAKEYSGDPKTINQIYNEIATFF